MLLLTFACAPPSGATPTLSELAPAVVCDLGVEVEVVAAGSGFAPVPVDLLSDPTLVSPTLRLERTADPTGASDTVEAAFDHSVTHGTLVWIDASTLTFSAARALGWVAGVYDAQIENPDGQQAALADALVWTDPPRITALSPEGVCTDSMTDLRLEGENLLVVDGVGPVVTVGGVAVEATPTECVPLAGEGGDVCAAVLVAVDGGSLAIGSVDIEVTTIDACSAQATLEVAPPPTITSVSPDTVCGTVEVTLSGFGFPTDPTVTIGGVAATVLSADAATIVVSPGDGTPVGTLDVVVSSAGGCIASTTMEVVAAPEVWFVDPPVVPQAHAIDVTVWIADLSGDVVAVWVDDGATRTELPYTWDPGDPNRLLASLPLTLSAGTYTVGFEQSDGCGGELAEAIVVSDDADVALDAVDPGYAWAWDDTPVQLLAADPIPTGKVGFHADARVYVSASDSGASTAIRGVTWWSEGLLTATVPPGLSPGTYDVFVVNPDGSLGVLGAGLTVTEERPPAITSVTPPGLLNTVSEEITVRGTSFRDPSVSLTCREEGVESTVPGVVTSATTTRIEATVPSDDFGQAVCVVEVVNADGPSATWAALTIRNPSENLFPWETGSDLVEARRAPAAVAARTSAVERWVYAFGGDAGEVASASSTLERAPVGVYGDPGEWALLPSVLPSPLTRANATVIGHFVYLVGGDDGTGLVDGGWRARVLDPLDVPRFANLGIDAGSLGPGTWTWRISAVYASDDVANPDGESLPGDPIDVTLPDVGGLAVTLEWDPISDAAAYRIYRSVEADQSGEEYVGETTDTSFRDDGLPTDPTRVPLDPGALGEWIPLPALQTPRAGACIAIATDPEPDPVRVYLYAAGGEDASGDVLDTVEVLDVVVIDADEHRDGAWSDAGVTLSEARADCGAWTVDATRHSVVDDETTWLYFGGGEGESRTHGTVDAGRVAEGGALDEWQEIDSMSPARAGYGVASGSDFLYAFGGSGGEPSTSGVSAELGDDPMPEVHNWNSLGTSLAEARHLPGSAQESAVIFVFGGQTDTESASRSVDVTRW